MTKFKTIHILAEVLRFPFVHLLLYSGHCCTVLKCQKPLSAYIGQLLICIQNSNVDDLGSLRRLIAISRCLEENSNGRSSDE